MEDKVEQVLSCSLLSGDLKVAVLKALEIVDTVVCQKIQTELHAFDFFDDEFDDLQRVSLLMDLFDYIWLFYKNRVNELD